MTTVENLHAMPYLQIPMKMFDPKLRHKMTTEGEPKIAVVAANGWVFRNLLETNLLSSAGLFDQVVFILDQRLAKDGASLLEAKGARYVVVEFQRSKALLWLKSLFLYLEVFLKAPRYSENKFHGPVKRFFLNVLKAFRMFRIIGPFHSVVQSALEMCLKREAATLSMPDFDIFLSASPNAVEDNLVAIRSRDAGRPVANLILSWDNIYSKGYMAPADLYVVWGDVMAKQLTALFGVPAFRISVLGAPHIGGLRPQCGFACSRDTLLYSTAAAVHFPDEKELVSQLAKDFAAGAFLDFARLVIRTHPAGPNALYDDLANPEACIFVEHPTSLGKREISQWVPDTNELTHLGQQLSRVSVAINMASTMSLDCLAHGISVINVTAALNGRDLSRHYRSEHYTTLLDLDLIRLAGSYVELVEAINNARKTPDLAIAERIQSFIRPTDTDAISGFRSSLLSLSGVSVIPSIKVNS
jgi:hypothetical protein